MVKTGFSYFGVRNPEHVRTDMQRMVREGNTLVLHTWSEDDQSYYKGTMKEIVALSREEGLEVYVNPWAVGRIFGGEANSELIARHPECRQYFNDGTPTPAACLNHPAVIEYLEEWTRSVCETQVDTIFWDEPHYFFRKGREELWACHCPVCRELFQQRFGRPMPIQFTEDVKTFREECIEGLLARLTGFVHKFGKRNCVCLLPDHFNAGTSDWDRIAALPCVDELSTDPYWEMGDSAERVQELYETYSRRVVDVARRHGKANQVWIKNYRITQAEEGHVELATRLACEAGCENVMSWSWRGSPYLSWLSSERPEEVHARQLAAFATAAQGGYPAVERPVAERQSQPVAAAAGIAIQPVGIPANAPSAARPQQVSPKSPAIPSFGTLGLASN
ncbi:MAG: hypothetical protein RL318_143 [Fibrobacterota bacterium]